MEPQPKKKKQVDDASEGSTDPEQLQEDLQLPVGETAQTSATKEKVSFWEGWGWERET